MSESRILFQLRLLLPGYFILGHLNIDWIKYGKLRALDVAVSFIMSWTDSIAVGVRHALRVQNVASDGSGTHHSQVAKRLLQVNQPLIFGCNTFLALLFQTLLTVIVVDKQVLGLSPRVQDVDRGWAWVVLACAFITRLILGGLIWTMTVYFVVFHEEFGESRSLTSLIGSVTIATLHAAGPISTHFMQRYGTRVTNVTGALLLAINFAVNSQANGVVFLIITHCLFFGFGLCLTNNSSLVALNEYFDRHLYMATGFSLAGSGIGIFLFAFFVPVTIDVFGWRGASFILAGCALQVCICGAVIFPMKRSKKKVNSKNIHRSKNRCPTWCGYICTSASYWLMNFSFLFVLASFTIITVFYKDFAVFRGMGDKFSWALAGYGAGDITGRLLAGIIAARMNVCLQSSLTHLCAMIVILSHLAVTDVIGLTICAFLLGAVVGAQVALMCMIPAAVFGKELFVVVIGYVQTVGGVGAILGPPIAGFIADSTNSYSWTLVFAALVDLVAAMFVMVIYILNRSEKRATTGNAIEEMKQEAEEDDVKKKMLNDKLEETVNDVKV